MSHRIDIELTSQTGDTWTWRAAGAKQPKGVLGSDLLYGTAQVGDVVRAEAERELDGVRIVSVIAPRSARETAERVEIIAREQTGGVSVTYADKPSGRRDGGRGDRPDRGPRKDGDRPDRGPRRDGPRSERPTRDVRSDRPDRAPRGDRPVGESRPRVERPAREVVKQRRLNPGRIHRDAFLEGLAPEKRPVADQLFRGGIPAVRQAIIDQNAQLKAAGQPEVPTSSLLSMADELLPGVRTADWLDRAAAALEVADEITLRDLRAVVTQADQSARDDASREMGAKLREALARRVEGERTTWTNDIDSAINEGKVVRALRLSARVPDPGAKLSAEVTVRLVAASNEAMNPQARPDVWAAIIEAAADAPFRREISPVGLPENPGESLLATAANASNRIPALLKLLGLTMPPPPRSKAVAGAPVVPKRPPAPPVLAPRLPTVSAPVATAPADRAPVGADPVGSDPADRAPVGADPVGSDPVEAAHTPATETAAIETPTIETAAIETAAIETAAIETATAQTVSAESLDAVDAPAGV